MKRAVLLVLAMIPAALGATLSLLPARTNASGAERLVAVPAVLRLGSADIGTRLAYRTTLTNGGTERLTLDAYRADCGCGEYSLSRSSLAPSESAVLEGSLDVTRPGPVASSIVVSTLEFPDEAVEIELEYEGNASAYLPVPNLPLGRSLRADGGFHVKVPIHVGVCSGSFHTGVAEVTGDLAGDLNLAEPEPREGLLFFEGVLRRRDCERFGALEARVAITVDDCTEAPLVARLLADTAPDGMSSDSWPSGRIVVQERETFASLPATVVHCAQLLDPEHERLASMSFDQTAAGDARLVLTLAEQVEGEPLPRAIDVRLSTSRGPGVLRYLIARR